MFLNKQEYHVNFHLRSDKNSYRQKMGVVYADQKLNNCTVFTIDFCFDPPTHTPTNNVMAIAMMFLMF